MLIIVPSSESKRPPQASGRPVALEELSFPALLSTRRRIAEALVKTSADLEAFERLGVRLTMAREVARNTRLFELPAMPVLDLYTGPVHDGLDASRLSADATWRAVLPGVLAEAAGDSGVVVDIHSPSYQAAGWPTGLGDRTVALRIDQGVPGHRIGEVITKRARGAAAHYLLESGADPANPHHAYIARCTCPPGPLRVRPTVAGASGVG